MPFESYETPFISYAQAREDVVLVRSLREIPPEQGFYIDIGGFHPHLDSVTKAFYDVGWHGINVEPSPELMAAFHHERTRDINLEVAVSSQPGELVFFGNENGQLGTLEERYADPNGGRRVVQALTLTSICEAHAPKDIHFLKIDVEGHERDVLDGMDFKRFRPWILLIESVVPNTHIPTYQEWEEIVVSSGYKFVLADAINRYYLAEEHIKLEPNFSLVADNFYQARERWNFEAAQHRIEELEEELHLAKKEETSFSEQQTDLTTLPLEAAKVQNLQAELASIRAKPKGILARVFG